MIEAKKRLQTGIPYLRHAIEKAKKKTGVVRLAIVSKNQMGLETYSVNLKLKTS